LKVPHPYGIREFSSHVIGGDGEAIFNLNCPAGPPTLRETVGFKPGDVQGLEAATVADLSAIEISPSGFGLHFPAVDADVWLPGLLAGHFGSKNWMAARMGKAGGKVRSPAKTAACRANGAKGGRPRKHAA